MIASAQQAPEKASTLLQRARYETTTLLVEDARHLSRYEQPLLYARLVQLWASTNNPEIDGWKKLALSGIERRPTDQPEENRQRIVTASRIYALFASVDSALADRVLNTIVSDIDEFGASSSLSEAERDQLKSVAFAIGDAAARHAADDPAKATALARTILALRDGDAFARLITGLRATKSPLADSLFQDAVDSVNATMDARLAAGIIREMFGNSASSPVSESEQSRLVQVADAVLAQPPATDAERRDLCTLAAILGRLSRKFEWLHLERADQIGCTCDTLPDDQWEALTPPRGQQLKSVDDYIQAATASPRSRDRAFYRMYAAHLLLKTDGVAAIALAGNIPREDRVAYPKWREDFLKLAMSAVLAHHKNGNSRQVEQSIQTAPPALRPAIGIRLYQWARKNDEQPFATTMLKSAFRSLDRAALDDPRVLIDLINGYASTIPDDAFRVVFTVLPMLNDTPHPPSFWKNPGEARSYTLRHADDLRVLPPLGDAVLPANINADVLAVRNVDDELRRVNDPADRASVRLGIIKTCMEQLTTRPIASK